MNARFSVRFLCTLAALHIAGGVCVADLIITGVVDGTRSGDHPKAMELLATADIADLSDFYIVRDTDGSSGTFTVSSFISLPDVSLSEGDFYYIYADSATEAYLESEGFGNTSPGFATALPDGIANHDGNDILAVATASDGSGILDAFGLLGQNGTFSADAIAYRQPDTPPDADGELNAGNFDIVGYNDLAFTSTFGTYQLAAIPEPSAFLFGGLVGILLALRRTRRRRWALLACSPTSGKLRNLNERCAVGEMV